MGESTTIRVLIADDHPIFRMGLRKLLESDGGVTVIGEASCGRQALEMAQSLQPDVMLLDVAMPDISGLDVLRTLNEDGLKLKIVLLTASLDAADAMLALRLGAVGVMLKTTASELLFKCLRSVMAGQYWIGRDSLNLLIEAFLQAQRAQTDPDRRPYGLTKRELEVVELIATGASNKDIAAQLQLSEETVKHHLSKIFDKTGQSSRVELALFASQLGLPRR
jgi:two-component system, NarL family, nitrate/nitrite response regulator NarL